MSLFLVAMLSGYVIKDWDNPDHETLLNKDNIIEGQINFFDSSFPFTSNFLQCSETISYCPHIKSSSDYYQLKSRIDNG